MLVKLKLTNVILIESCEIPFTSGLNIISGETGAGKSAIIHAIECLLGARADTSIIRQGADAATIEATFSDGLTIKREIFQSRPSKAWVNGQLMPIGQLQEQNHIELIGQGAYHTLKSPAAQLKLLDHFGKTDRLAFSEAYATVLELGPPPNQKELNAIGALNLQDNEEEELFAEHHRLANASDLTEKTQNLLSALDEITTQLGALQRIANQIDNQDSISSAITELQEAHYHFSHYLDKLESSPERLAFIEERLSAINAIKRQYACAFADLKKLSHELSLKLNQIEEATALRDTLAKKLSSQRLHAAQTLSQQITESLQMLGMEKAAFDIEIKPAALSITGADTVQFVLSANPGEAAIPLHLRASGGELSRVMLALKMLSKDQVSTFIFDEIDSNIGGKTASCIGSKLKELGQKSQVICITHFPQVAAFADHHLQITKVEKDGRTVTQIKKLEDNNPEILRMLGGESFTKKL